MDTMTLSEAFWYMEGEKERNQQKHILNNRIVWSGLAPYSKDEIDPNFVFPVPGLNKKAVRGGVSKEEHLKLIEQYQRIKAKEHDRTSQKREGVRIKHNSIGQS